MTTAEHATPPLVGRQDERRLLESSLRALAAGEGGLVAITGEAGIGKTRLLRHVAERADACGIRTASSDRGAPAPYGPVATAVEPLLGAAPASTLRRLGDEQIDLLAPMLPSLAARSGRAPAEAPERWRSHRAARDLLVLLSSDEPLLLVLDDLHAADDATVELMVHLIRRGPVAGLLVAFAFRGHEACPLLRDAVDLGELDRTVERIALAPLTEPETAALAGERIDPEARRAIYEQSGGNPLIAEQLAGRATTGAPIPEWILAATVDELAGLDERGRLLISAAAVLGDDFDVDAAGAIAGLDDAVTMETYDSLVARTVLRQGAASWDCAFRHPLLRRVAYESIGAGERVRLHRRAVDVLRRRGAPVWELAHHVERSAAHGDRAAVEVLIAAGRAGAAADPSGSARWFAAAIDLLARNAPPRLRLDVLLALADATAACGRLADSRAALASALALAEDPLAGMRVQIVTRLAQLRSLSGQHEESAALIAREIAHAKGGLDSCALQLALAGSRYMAGQPAPAAEAATAALAIATAVGDDAHAFAAHAQLACLSEHSVDVRGARRHGTQALVLFDTLAGAELVPHVDRVLMLGCALISRERLRLASRVLERAMTAARDAGSVVWSEPLLVGLAECRLLAGRLDESAALADEALEASLVTGNPQLRMRALAACALSAHERGDAEMAIAASGAAAALAEASPHTPAAWHAHVARAFVLLEHDRAEAAWTARPTPDGAALADVPAALRTQALALVARAAVERGRLDEAEDWVRRAEASARALGGRGRAATAGCARARLLLARGESSAAALLAREQAAAHAAVGMPVEAARSHALAAVALQAHGDVPAAAAQLKESHALASEAGAIRLSAWLDQELARLGDRPGGVATTPPFVNTDLLTAREQHIATLVADGLGNAEIADQLRLSPRSVERDLTTLRRKLSVGSRPALASLVARHRERFAYVEDRPPVA